MRTQIDIVHEDLRIVQAFKRVQQIINSISFSPIIGSAGISNILFVDLVTGNDGTAVVGSLVNKFQTIQGAFNRITTDGIPNRVVFVSPGTYNENLIWPAIDNITLQGSGQYNTFVIGSVAANPSLIINTAIAITTGQIKDINILPTTSNDALVVDGTLSGGNSFTNVLSLQNVFLGNGATDHSFFIHDINVLSLNNVIFGIGIFTNISLAVGNELESLKGNLICNYDSSLPVPSNGKIGNLINSSELNDVTVNKIANFTLTANNSVLGIITGNLTDTATDHGELNVRCSVGNVNINFNLTNIDNGVGDFDLAKINGSLNVNAIGGTKRGIVTAKNAVFVNTLALITAGNLSDIDIRGAQFEQSQLNLASTGTINRSIHRVLSPTPITPAGVPVPIVPPFSGGTYTIIPELNPAGTAAGLIIGVAAKSNNQFIAVSNVVSPGPVDFCVFLGD